jgi:pyrroloquinoline quinone (PQQ) biosynthesis protein C
VNCPNPEWRSRIAEVVYEEGTGRLFSDGIPHNRLYLDVGNDVGVSDDEMWNTDYCGEALGFKAYFISMCQGPTLDAVSCHMLGAEAQGPGVFTTLAKGFKEHYGMTDKGAKFWIVHDEADEDHSNVGVELLADFAPTDKDRERVVEVVHETIDMTFLLYDGIHKRMQALA